MPIIKVPKPQPDPNRVTSYRLLNQLFTDVQRLVLDAVFEESKKLTFAERQSALADQSATTDDGLPIIALMGIGLAYKDMEAIIADGSKLDLKSPDMSAFLTAVAACGVFGADAGTIASEIARIQANQTA